MKMLVFYRSKEVTNSIASATRDQLAKNPCVALDVEFINLDKRSYTKVLKFKEEAKELPDVIYIWYDEEKVGDYIKENYPNVRVEHFDTAIIDRVPDGYSSYSTKAYRLSDMMIKHFKETLVKREMWIVNLRDYTIKKEMVDDLDVAAKGRNTKGFNSEKDAKDFCVTSLQAVNERKQEAIKGYMDDIKRIRKEIKANEKLIAKYT